MAIDVKLKLISLYFILKDHSHSVLRKDIVNAKSYDVYKNLRHDEGQLLEKSDIFGASIRKASARLPHDGLVETLSRKGAFIHQKLLIEIYC